MGIVDHFCRFKPRYGPEWGSGGIFGLRYHRGVLYFTLAFEARAYFVTRDRERVYSFELVGPPPRSGGDTYNAVETVDDCIYFGGWVHAPAVYGGRKNGGGVILFENKYSHLHYYDIREDKVALLWKEGIHHREKWAGEISEIVYDPVNDQLLVARGDGHVNLGVYSIDRRSGKATRLSDRPALKGCPYLDYACFDVMRSWEKGLEAIQCLDFVTGKWTVTPVDYAKESVDGHGVEWPLPGCAASAYARAFFFVRGGVIVGNPADPREEPLRFARLFDFGHSGYSPTRTVALPVGGGILTAFNAYTHGLVKPRTDKERRDAEAVNTIVAPSLLVYITPPVARIVAALGARITSLESAAGKILAATDTTANLGALDAMPVDAGHRDILVFSQEILFARSPPVEIVVPGRAVKGRTWGGIPLCGYSKPRLILYAQRDTSLTVYEYDLSLPLAPAETDKIRVCKGREVIDLSGFHGIVSFRAENGGDNIRKIVVKLE